MSLSILSFVTTLCSVSESNQLVKIQGSLSEITRHKFRCDIQARYMGYFLKILTAAFAKKKSTLSEKKWSITLYFVKFLFYKNSNQLWTEVYTVAQKKLVPCYLVKTKSYKCQFFRKIQIQPFIFYLVKTDMSLFRHLISYFVFHIPQHLLKLTKAHLFELRINVY